MSSARFDATTFAGVGTLTIAPPFSAGCRAVDETDNRLERHFHFEACGARLLATRLDLRIICD